MTLMNADQNHRDEPIASVDEGVRVNNLPHGSGELVRGFNGQLVAAFVFRMAGVPADDCEAHLMPGEQLVQLAPVLFVFERLQLLLS